MALNNLFPWTPRTGDPDPKENFSTLGKWLLLLKNLVIDKIESLDKRVTWNDTRINLGLKANQNRYYTSQWPTITALIAHIGSASAKVYVNSVVTLTANLTVPSNITIEMVDGGYFDQGAYTLAFGGPFIGGSRKWFYGAGAVTFSAGSVCDMLVMWWGPTLDDVTDNAAILAKAIAANANCNAVIQIPKRMRYISDISTPVNWKGQPSADSGATPFLINTIPYTGANLHARMYCDDRYLYVCQYTNGEIAVFELSDPRYPRFLIEFTVGSQPRHCYKVGKFLFVACHGAASIEVYDLGNPGSPSLVTTITTGANPKHFLIIGKFMYVVCAGAQTLEKYDISSIYGTSDINIRMTASLSLGMSPLCVARDEEGFLAVCGLSTALLFVGETNLNLISSFTLPGNSHGTCAVLGHYVLISDGVNNQINVVNVQDLGTPQLVISVASSTSPEQIEIAGNRLYVPSLTAPGVQAYLDCFDITNIRAPYLYKSVPLTVTGAGFTARSGNFIYVNGHWSPYDIDVVEIEPAPQRSNGTELIARSGMIAELSYEVSSQAYKTTTSNYTITAKDSYVRVGLGATITLPNPTTIPYGRVVMIKNVHATLSSAVSNAFAGYSGTLLAGQSVILCVTLYSGTAQWDDITRSVSLADPQGFGAAIVGTWPVNAAFSMFAHSALNNAVNGNYALLQQNDGTTYLNAASGKDLYLNIGGTNYLRVGSSGAVTCASPTGGLGYGAGAGGTVTQATDKSTGVTLSKVTGQITMNGAALNAGVAVSFTLTNTAIAATDILETNHASVGNLGDYSIMARCAAGSATITVRNVTAVNLSEAIVIGFVLHKGATT